jgi:hypothetical protein
MFPMNPYAGHLGARNPREVIAQTPGLLASVAERLGPQGLERALAPGKWSARAILCHLADCEIAFGFRLRQALAERHHVVQPLDQEAWAVRYDSYSADAALATFSALRAWNRALVDTVSPEDLEKKLTHPERGEMTFQVLVDTMAGHDLNHLGQLETIASRFAASA